MMLYFTTRHAAAELRRQELLAEAERERWAATAGAQVPRAIVTGNVGRLVSSATELLRSIGPIWMPPASSSHPAFRPFATPLLRW